MQNGIAGFLFMNWTIIGALALVFGGHQIGRFCSRFVKSVHRVDLMFADTGAEVAVEEMDDLPRQVSIRHAVAIAIGRSDHRNAVDQHIRPTAVLIQIIARLGQLVDLS